MTYWLGIDGGGSHLRVVVTTGALTRLAQVQAETANPSTIGRDAAAIRIQSAVRDVLAAAALNPADLSGIGIGIAGASVAHSENWLREVVTAVAPGVPLVLSSDAEIALVGALGRRFGVLVLAGTGSVACGVNAEGHSLQVGGWGYLLGDEGGGYWIVREAMSAVLRAADGRDTLPSQLRERLLIALGVQTEIDMAMWLYESPHARIREVAQFAPLVLEAAQSGDPVALRIVENAAGELALLCRTVSARLNMDAPPVAFAGGLLDNDNALSQRLCDLLGLAHRPVALYPPVIGAALLARITLKGESDHAD